MRNILCRMGMAGAGMIAFVFPASTQDKWTLTPEQRAKMTPEQIRQAEAATASQGGGAASQPTQTFGTTQAKVEPSDQIVCSRLQMPVSLAPAGTDAGPESAPLIRFSSKVLKATYAARTAGKSQEDPQKIEVTLVRGMTAKKASEKIQKFQVRESEYGIYRLKVEWGRKDLAAYEDVFAVCGEGITGMVLEKEIGRYVRTVAREDFRFSKMDLHPEVSVKLQEEVKPGWKGESIEQKVKAKLDELRQKMGKKDSSIAAVPGAVKPKGIQ